MSGPLETGRLTQSGTIDTLLHTRGDTNDNDAPEERILTETCRNGE